MIKLFVHIILFIHYSLFTIPLFAQQTEKLFLSGTGSDHTVKWDFYCTEGMNSGKWSTIAVPSCWELQGFGKYDYGFAKDSTRGKEKGLYKYSFTVPSSWKDKIVKIVFEGSMTDTEVKINGQQAGPTHQGAFYAFKYNITSLLRFGRENLLEVTVAKHSSNESVNAAERRADFWLFGGIFRPVYLEALPQQHIERIAIDAKANGEFKGILITNGNADKISLQLYQTNGSRFGNEVISNISKNAEIIIKTKFTNPLLWTSEFPHLYTAVFSLYGNGKILHTQSKKIGFRTIEIKERDGVYINGVKVKMKGVNRHSFRPETGRSTSKKISIEDVLLMKDMNMNAVRMSHYPPDDHFLDVCDSLGLFVMDELAGWHGNYDTKTGFKLVKEMIDHDQVHPSIIFWSNGNEGGHNTELVHLFKEEDIQLRPVLHPWQLFGGIETQHYREYNYGIGSYDHGHDIVMPTEFLHGLYDGGHGAGLEDYWETMWKEPLSAGGFLWDFADQGIVRTDKNGIVDTDGNHGADGIVGPHHEKEGSYFAIKEIWSPIYFEKKEITKSFDGFFNIENRYHFTNTNQCSFSYQLKKWVNGRQTVLDGRILSPDSKPGEKARLKINMPSNWEQYDVLYITAKDLFKREIFTWSFCVSKPVDIAKSLMPLGQFKNPELVVQDSGYAISANNINILIDKRTGILQQVKKGNVTIPIHNGPVLQEGMNNFQNFSYRFDGNNLIVESTIDKKNSYNFLQWTVYPSGMIKMEVKYFPAEYFTTLVGVNFSFPEKEIKSVQYMGNGPYRVWKNRMKGNRFAVWNKNYNNTETGETPWIYPEFKGYYSNLYWCKFLTTDHSFMVMTENEDLFLRLFTPAFKTDPWKNYELVFPNGDISFMQAIPGIGSKTQRSETTGPMGMKSIFYDYEKDPSRALRMILYFNFSGNE